MYYMETRYGGVIVKNIKEDYFEYLKDIVDEGNDYDVLLKELHGLKYTWELPLDGDRALDGKGLRDQYISDMCAFGNSEALDGDCSVLEMLIALAQNMDRDCFDNYDYKDRTGDFFWEMLANLDLVQFTDRAYEGAETLCDIHERVETWLSRSFDFDGVGSIFPLRDPESDQRHNLIWYQKEAYLAENYPDE